MHANTGNQMVPFVLNLRSHLLLRQGVPHSLPPQKPGREQVPGFCIYSSTQMSWEVHVGSLFASKASSPFAQRAQLFTPLPTAREKKGFSRSQQLVTLMNCLAVAPAAKDTDVQEELKGISP